MHTLPHVEQVTREQWATLSRSFDDYNYHQNYEFAQRSGNAIGASVEFVRICDGANTIGAASVRLKALPFLGTGIAYVNHGPLARLRQRETSHDTNAPACIDALVEEYAQRRRFMLRVVLPIDPVQITIHHRLGHLTPDNDTRRGRRGYRTILINLDTSESEIRARLHQKWRNCLNRAERQDMQVVSGTDPELFARFMPLFDALCDTKGFKVDLNPRFFWALQDKLPDNEKLIIHLAQHKGRTIAGHIGSYVGATAVYLFGAASDEGHRLNASYRMQWEVITRARAMGCHWYDLGGIDPLGNPGVYRFKKRMGGIEATAAGPFEFAPPLRRGILLGAEQLYNFLMRR